MYQTKGCRRIIDLIAKDYPEMVVIFRGRDEDDIKIINRLIDVIEKVVK